MKVVVCVKQTLMLPGPAVMLADGRGVDPAFLQRRINDADEYAVEEALRLCERSGGGEVLVVTVGPEPSEEALRKCLAMGVDRAMRIWGDGVQVHDPLSVARALAQTVRAEAASLVLCGVQSTDMAQQATGPALASALGVPCITIATKIEPHFAEQRAVVHREAGAGCIEVLETPLPCVITVQTGLNTPRVASFKGVMNAKKKPIQLIDPGEIARSRIELLEMKAAGKTRGQLRWIEGGAEVVAASIRELARKDSA